MDNIILATDSYKISHWKQYPPNTQKVYSYFESRGSRYKEIVFFGLQYILKKYLAGNIVTAENIDEAEQFCISHFGTTNFFNRSGWEYILNRYNGRLPLEIKAVLEGSIHSSQEILFTVENTDPQCFWLTSYIEGILEQVWYPSTIASISRKMKKDIAFYLEETGSDPTDYKLYDFGFRGSTSHESSSIGGAAHLLNFKGTDNIVAIQMLQQYYDAKEMPAVSIPAAEHSTIIAWGKDQEVEAYRNMLDQFPGGHVAVVSDSYDIYNACENLWGKELKDRVIHRNGTVVIRPDSGNPVVVLPKVLEILEKAFGTTKNAKGFKVLPPYIRVIQADGISDGSLAVILWHLQKNEWSVDNVTFGSGGGLLQNVNRDTFRFAYKCSNVTIDGVDYPVSKDPITDSGKKSKAGRFDDLNLETVFFNGELVKNQTLDEIRNLAQ